MNAVKHALVAAEFDTVASILAYITLIHHLWKLTFVAIEKDIICVIINTDVLCVALGHVLRVCVLSLGCSFLVFSLSCRLQCWLRLQPALITQTVVRKQCKPEYTKFWWISYLLGANRIHDLSLTEMVCCELSPSMQTIYINLTNSYHNPALEIAIAIFYIHWIDQLC